MAFVPFYPVLVGSLVLFRVALMALEQEMSPVCLSVTGVPPALLLGVCGVGHPFGGAQLSKRLHLALWQCPLAIMGPCRQEGSLLVCSVTAVCLCVHVGASGTACAGGI